MADRYIFPAIFYPPQQGNLDYCVVFPDLDVATQGETLEQSLDMAKELLELTLYGLEDDGENIPIASDPSCIVLDIPDAFVSLISVYMPMVRIEMDQQFVRKTVTLPKWLNDAAEDAGLNFSRSLQTALRLKLDISNHPIHGTAKNKKKLLKKGRK